MKVISSSQDCYSLKARSDTARRRTVRRRPSPSVDGRRRTTTLLLNTLFRWRCSHTVRQRALTLVTAVDLDLHLQFGIDVLINRQAVRLHDPVTFICIPMSQRASLARCETGIYR